MDTEYKLPRPSEIMRGKCPYLYSDSTVTSAYELSRSEFSHYLETLTDRNQHKDFENFARRLCEREVCPNLRPQTGPEGGGDGKVDTDTYPVSDEISERWFLGIANSGNKTWGFAVSAMKKWSEKVRSDVEGLIGTGRNYDQIFFVTSRAARSKDRLRIEQELLHKYATPVTILDREWIIEKTIENHHQKLAFEELRAGRFDPSKIKLGPNDIRRKRQLEKLERFLSDHGGSQRELTKAVSQAFEATHLSRELEVPRVETDGRFQRAISLAEKYGDTGQVLRARYEHVWTALWWFDDVSGINDEYEAIEDLAFKSCFSVDASRVCNLFQVLIGCCHQGRGTSEQLDVKKRGDRLFVHLEAISKNTLQPNNALFGAALLELHKLATLPRDSSSEMFDEGWKNLTSIVDNAEGMGEFPATMIDEVVEMLSPFVSDSAAFDSLLERLAEFMGERARDGKAGKICLNRGRQKVESEEPIDAIAWLGKASYYFMKEEYREEQFECLLLLSDAYRAVGLLWAARAVCLAALVQIKALSAEGGEQREELVSSVLQFIRLNLELGRIPDFLYGVLWLRSLQGNVDLTKRGEKHLADEFKNLDQLFACLIAAAPQPSISLMSGVPDILDRLGLHVSRPLLLFRLGYARMLLEEGALPNEQALEEMGRMADMFAAQPAASSLTKYSLNFGLSPLEINTTILGVDVRAHTNSEQETLIGEAQLAALEAFAATALRSGAMPIAKALNLEIKYTSIDQKPSLNFEAEKMLITSVWPKDLSMVDIGRNNYVSSFLVEFCFTAFSATTTLAGKYSTFLEILENELVLHRAILFSNAAHSHHRVFGKIAFTLDDLAFLDAQNYNEKSPPPAPNGSGIFPRESRGDGSSDTAAKQNERHDSLTVHSVTNTHLWDKAKWRGVVYASYGETVPLVMAFLFENTEGAKAIFRDWRSEFGQRDELDQIRISILSGIDEKKPLAYRTHITHSRSAIDKDEVENKSILQLSRMQTMYPTSSENLQRFLSDYRHIGCYLIAPAETLANGKIMIHRDLALLKRDLHIKEAWMVGPDDEAMMALLDDDNIIVPADVTDPPCKEAMALRRKLQNNRR
ncbi:MAG: hypothetical protein ACNYPE_04200 [Candidatus Azotimanducaceae bacterium WSBS_2022_MAG_OTU7]